ncbi:MAG: hypothetical protein Kow0099_36280 [Candidatus Abyssubacteria bacterium]
MAGDYERRIITIAAVVRLIVLTLLAGAVSAAFAGAHGSELEAGMQAPDFKLPSTDGTPISLSDYKGKSNVLLSFYVFDFSPT